MVCIIIIKIIRDKSEYVWELHDLILLSWLGRIILNEWTVQYTCIHKYNTSW